MNRVATRFLGASKEVSGEETLERLVVPLLQHDHLLALLEVGQEAQVALQDDDGQDGDGNDGEGQAREDEALGERPRVADSVLDVGEDAEPGRVRSLVLDERLELRLELLRRGRLVGVRRRLGVRVGPAARGGGGADRRGPDEPALGVAARGRSGRRLVHTGARIVQRLSQLQLVPS